MPVTVGALIGFSAFQLCAQTAAVLETLAADRLYNLAADWILDSDARHRAWAAELIAANRFVTLYPRLETALNALQPLAPKFTGTPEEFALEAVSDAIIRVNLQVPASDALSLYPAFPALSMILLSRAVDDSRPALLSIVRDSQVSEVWLAAANLLARNPTHEFVTTLLDQFQTTVRIMILDQGYGGGISANDCFMLPKRQIRIPSDWPSFSVYSLRVTNYEPDIIAPGPTTIGFLKSDANTPPWAGQIGCGRVDVRRVRLGLIAQLAEVDPPSLTLKDFIDHQIVIESNVQYQRDVMGLVQQQAEAFYAVVSQLKAKGLLTEAEARERRLHMNIHVVPMGSRRTAPEFPDLRQLGIVAEIHSAP